MKVFRRYKPKEVLTFNWSANLAYAVGLITTDGCLFSNGDGPITTFTDNYNTFKKSTYVYERLFVRFISASKPHMEWLKETITRLLHVSGRLHKTKPNHLGHSMYILKFGKKESLKLLSHVYYSDQIPFLTRKKSIYIKFLDKTIHAS